MAQSLTALAALIMILGVPDVTAAQPLTASERTEFVSNTVARCMAGANALPRPLVESYCQCIANAVADLPTARELRDGRSADVREAMKSDARRCFEDAMKADASGTPR